MRYILGAIALFVLWLLMSGVYKPVTITLGAVSSVFAVWIAARANRIDGSMVQIGFGPLATVSYLGYLLWEIAKANVNVVIHILSPKMRFQSAYFETPYTQKTEVGQVTFANSITLTPGTLTVDVGDGTFAVHALDYQDGDKDALKAMNDRISRVERS